MEENEQDISSEEGNQSKFEEDDREYLKAAEDTALATAAISKSGEHLAHPSVNGSDREANEDPDHDNAFFELSAFSVRCCKNACWFISTFLFHFSGKLPIIATS